MRDFDLIWDDWKYGMDFGHAVRIVRVGCWIRTPGDATYAIRPLVEEEVVVVIQGVRDRGMAVGTFGNPVRELELGWGWKLGFLRMLFARMVFGALGGF